MQNIHISNNVQSEAMVRSTWKAKFTFGVGTAVEPDGDASLDVFDAWTEVLSLPVILKILRPAKLH